MSQRAWQSIPKRILIAAALLLVGVAIYWFARRPPRPDASSTFRLARGAITRGDLVAATNLCEEFLARQPNHPQITLLRAEVAALRGEHRHALQFLALIPDHPPAIAAEARLREGELHTRLGQASRAEIALRHALALDPAKTEAELRLREIYTLQLRRHDLRRLLRHRGSQHAWQLTDLLDFIVAGHVPKFLLGNWRDRVATFAQHDPTDQHSLLALATYHAAAGDHEQAAHAAQAVLEQTPNHPQARALVADALLHQGELDQAEQLITPAIDHGAADAWTLRAHGRIALAKHDYTAALESLGASLALDPGDPPSIYQLGLALEKTGDQTQAAERLRCGKRLQELVDVAQQLLDQRQRQAPEMLDTLVALGKLLFDCDLAEDATYCFELASTWNPDNRETRELAAESRKQFLSRPETDPPDNRPRSFKAETHAARSANSTAAPRTSAPEPLRFDDVAAATGLAFQYFTGNTGKKYLFETLGGGVAAFDYDGDGWTDLYFTQGSEFPTGSKHRDQLFRNRLGHSFEPVTLPARLGDPDYSLGTAAGDYDNDGFPDLFVANYGDNRTYRNNGDGTFSDATAPTGTASRGMNTSLALADLDRDGDLDLYVVNYVAGIAVCPDRSGAIYACHPSQFDAEQDRVFANQGDGTFLDQTEPAGFVAPDGKGLGIVVADLDGDRWPDVYVANDTTPNFLFHNRGAELAATALPEMRFQERGISSGSALSREGKARAGMGVACADLDANGLLDLYVTNYYLESNGLFLNHGKLWFVDSLKPRALVADTIPLLGFGTQAFDADRDGYPDLFVSNGHVDDYRPQDRNVMWKMPGKLYRNLGDLQFADVSAGAGPYFEKLLLGRAVARLDWNRDGRIDLAVVHQNESAALLENRTETPLHFVVIELSGTQSNRDAVNARIAITAQSRRQVVELSGGDGYLAANERRLAVGLGPAASIDHLEVTWPSGRVDSSSNIPARSEVRLIEGRPPQTRRQQGANASSRE